MLACRAHVCERGNAHGHIACGSQRLMLETIFGCFSALFPETRFSVKPSAQNVATLAHQLDLQSPCLCLTRLDFQVAPHCPDNLCGFWRSKFPSSCLYSKCFNDRGTFLTFYRYLWSKVSSLHRGRTKRYGECMWLCTPPYTWVCPLKSRNWIKFNMYMYFLLKKSEHVYVDLTSLTK